MTTETLLTDDQIARMRRDEFGVWRAEDHEDIERFARAIEQAVLQSVGVSRWVNVNKGEPHCNGTYVVRINQHGHLRLGYRILNSDTLRYQWQVDGEICSTVTHYLPIPALTLSERES